jgi:hypothetical protein
MAMHCCLAIRVSVRADYRETVKMTWKSVEYHSELYRKAHPDRRAEDYREKCYWSFCKDRWRLFHCVDGMPRRVCLFHFDAAMSFER